MEHVVARRPRRRPRVVVAVAAGVLVVTTAGPAVSLYGARGVGSAGAKAASLHVPPAPAIGSTTGLALACLVGLSWSAPPAGEQYTIRRTIGATTVVVAGPTATSGSTTDSVLLTQLGAGKVPSYTTTAHWVTAPAWTRVSPTATASGCLDLL